MLVHEILDVSLTDTALACSETELAQEGRAFSVQDDGRGMLS